MQTTSRPAARVYCQPLRAEDAPEAVRLIARAFTTREPMARALEISMQEFTTFLSLCLPRMIEEGLSVVARDRGTGRMVGAVLADSLGGPALPPWPDGPEGERARTMFAPLLAALATLDEQWLAERQARDGQVLHVALVGVDEAAARDGIARLLLEACIGTAEARGFASAIAEVTSGASHRLFRSHGFLDRFVVPYARFEFGGARPFASIANESGVVLMERVLSAP